VVARVALSQAGELEVRARFGLGTHMKTSPAIAPRDTHHQLRDHRTCQLQFERTLCWSVDWDIALQTRDRNPHTSHLSLSTTITSPFEEHPAASRLALAAVYAAVHLFVLFFCCQNK
jgi:hypothetical protein